MDDIFDEKNKNITEATMLEHKKQLIRHKEDKDEKHVLNTTEVLFSLRLHALQTSTNLKKFFIYEFIKNDVFCLTDDTKGNQFILEMFEINNFSLTQALLALLSIIASSGVGRDYLIQNGISIVDKVIQVCNFPSC